MQHSYIVDVSRMYSNRYLANSKLCDVLPHLWCWNKGSIPLGKRAHMHFLCKLCLERKIMTHSCSYTNVDMHVTFRLPFDGVCFCTAPKVKWSWLVFDHKRGLTGEPRKIRSGCMKSTILTFCCRNLKHCWFRTSTNSDSKSWSLYQAPPVTDASGSKLYNMNTFFLAAWESTSKL